MEKVFSQGIVTMLNYYRDIRDGAEEFVFRFAYDNPWLDFIGSEAAPEKIGPREAGIP